MIIKRPKRIDKNMIALYMVIRGALIDKGQDVMEANINAHKVMSKIKKGLKYEPCSNIYYESLACYIKEEEKHGVDHK